jgi:hypothetical protein
MYMYIKSRNQRKWLIYLKRIYFEVRRSDSLTVR